MPKLIIIGGPPATGKTTTAKMLVKELGYILVSMDVIKESLFDNCGSIDRVWSQDVGRLAFPVFKRFIEMYLERGVSVIAEATFLYPNDAEWLHDYSNRFDADLYQVWHESDPLVRRARFIDRANSEERHPGHCDSLQQVMDEFDAKFFNRSYIPLPLKAQTLVLNTTDFTNVDRTKIVQFIS